MVFLILAATVLLEWSVYAAFLRRRVFRLLGISLLANCLTNPTANLLVSLYPNLIVWETVVIVFEVLLLRFLIPLGWRRAVLVSAAANLVSFAAGFWLFS